MSDDPDPDGSASLAAAARTHVGRVRSENEDAHLVRADAGLFVVADGMGGHAAGEVASALAVEAIEGRLASDAGDPVAAATGAADASAASGTADRPPGGADRWSGPAEAGRAVEEAIADANRRIREDARRNPSRRGMGTTATVLLVHGAGRWVAGQVGDSRAYRLRGGELERLTTDHTVAPGSSTLTRALGTHDDLQVDVLDGELEAGDVFLLCSDGLTDMLSFDDIGDALAHALAGADGAGLQAAVGAAADALVEAALERGGHDNVTVVVVAAG